MTIALSKLAKKKSNVSNFRAFSENKEIHKKWFNVNLTSQKCASKLVSMTSLLTILKIKENILILYIFVCEERIADGTT